MSDEQLLVDLQELLVAYQDRRRGTDALMSRLKGVNEPLNKLRRALADYALQPTTLDPDQVASAQQGLEAIRYRETVSDPLLADLRRESKLLATLIGALRESVIALSGDVVDVVKLDRAYQTLNSSRLANNGLEALLPALAAALDDAQAQLGYQFGAALRDRLSEIGITLGGRPPEFEIGRFEIRADFVKRTAVVYYGKIQVAAGIKLSLDLVMKAYQDAVNHVEGRNEDGQRWMDMFYSAWQSVRRKSERGTARVSIVDCYYEMVLLRQSRNFNTSPSKRSFTDYTRAEFVHDLDRFTRAEPFGHDGQRPKLHVANKSQADSPSRSMWVVDGSRPHDGQYIADVEFEASRLF
jgi:hypothetical protein